VNDVLFDWKINFGHVISLLALVVAGVVFWFGVDRRLMQIELRTRLMWSWFKRTHGINGDISSDDLVNDEIAAGFDEYAEKAAKLKRRGK
jgi:hypothetical protein